GCRAGPGRRARRAGRGAALATAQQARALLEGAAAAVRTFLYVSRYAEGRHLPVYQGPGLAALLGLDRLPEDPRETVRLYLDAIHPDDRPLYDELSTREGLHPGRLARAEYRLVRAAAALRRVRPPHRAQQTR